MAQMMLYVLPLILGRTFDMDKDMVGVDIFPSTEANNPLVIQNPVSDTHYRIVDSTKEARDLLDVSGSFSLKVKGGFFKAGASGAYLTDTYNRQNTVDVVIKATYQTVTETLPPGATPVATWKQMGALGTHYVRSITYGGELIASVRLICNNTRDKQHIKASLEVGGRIEIFDVEAEVEGEYMKDIAKTVDTMQIKIYSSVPVSKVPHSMDALKEMLNVFPKDLKKYNDGKGVPLNVELWPLNYLDSTRPQYLKNSVLEAQLDTFEQKFDDLLNTRAAIADWMRVIDVELTEDQEKKIGELHSEVETTLRSFYDVIGELDMSQGMDQLNPALTSYGHRPPGFYYHRYQMMRQEMMSDQGAWTRSRGNGAIYVHWGKKNCSGSAETLSHGYAAGPGDSGGGANYICLPEEPQLAGDGPADNVATLEGTTYHLPNGEKSQLLCCTCRLAARGVVKVFSGVWDCPGDWDFLYNGILMSGSQEAIYTSFVCLETEPTLRESQLSESPLVGSWATEGKAREKKILPCTVCSK